MKTDADILAEIDAAFAAVEQPEHFTDPGWDPIAFASPQGMAYYFPALARIALSQPLYGYEWSDGNPDGHGGGRRPVRGVPAVSGTVAR
jgi:hypothetical protein